MGNSHKNIYEANVTFQLSKGVLRIWIDKQSESNAVRKQCLTK